MMSIDPLRLSELVKGTGKDVVWRTVRPPLPITVAIEGDVDLVVGDVILIRGERFVLTDRQPDRITFAPEKA
jgi:hypothetical protein